MKCILEFDNYVYTIAIVSVFASTINPIYTPAFIFIKFSEKEVNIFKFVTTNLFLSLFTFLYLQTIGISRVILIYIMFELLNLFGTNYLYKKNFENTSIFKLSKNFLLLVGFSFVDLFFTDLPLNRFIILSLIVLIFDFYSIYKLKDSYKLFFKI